MKFSVAVYAPSSAQAAHTAHDFVAASLSAGHAIYRLFFFDQGVTNAASLGTDLASEDILLTDSWSRLITRHELDAVVCVNSAQKHGIAIDEESGRPLAAGFVIGGLAQLIDGAINADRFITFG